MFPHRLDDEGKLRTNSLDCDVFAAVYATERVAGYGVAGLQAPFDVAAMRLHLEVETARRTECCN